jgi:hypothetical protein
LEDIMANLNMGFPMQGIDRGMATTEQPVQTSPDMLNVRPKRTKDKRLVGGQRPGLGKWAAGDLLGGGQPIVFILSVSSVE